MQAKDNTLIKSSILAHSIVDHIEIVVYTSSFWGFEGIWSSDVLDAASLGSHSKSPSPPATLPHKEACRCEMKYQLNAKNLAASRSKRKAKSLFKAIPHIIFYTNAYSL